MEQFFNWLESIITLLQPVWLILQWFVTDCVCPILALAVRNPLIALIIIAPSVAAYITRR